MSRFSLEDHVVDSLRDRTLDDAEEFAKVHGYSLRVVKRWSKGDWDVLIITADYIEKRINVSLSEDDTIDHVDGLG